MKQSILKFDFAGITKIISGGQTGADRAGIDAAKAFGIETGGMAPKGWRTEFGPAPELAELGLTEQWRPEYPFRTEQNVVNADATLIVGSSLEEGGTLLTRKLCHKHKKPFFTIKLPYMESHIDGLVKFIKDNGISVLNVAGNRDKAGQGTKHYDATYEIVMKMLNELAK